MIRRLIFLTLFALSCGPLLLLCLLAPIIAAVVVLLSGLLGWALCRGGDRLAVPPLAPPAWQPSDWERGR